MFYFILLVMAWTGVDLAWHFTTLTQLFTGIGLVLFALIVFVGLIRMAD